MNHRRTAVLDDIIGIYEKLLNERLGILEVEVASARELNEAQRTALTQGLHAATGKTVRLKTTVDASLIGGVTARIGSAVYDGSVRGRLAMLRRRLTAEA